MGAVVYRPVTQFGLLAVALAVTAAAVPASAQD
jgi:hypothetical protein